MTNFGAEAAQADLQRALKWKAEIMKSAHETRLPPALIAAIGSRETHWYPKWFLGDIDPVTHQPHGHGPLQVDDGARNGKVGPNYEWCLQWRRRWLEGDPSAVEDASILGASIWVAKHDDVSKHFDPARPDFLQIVCAAYNCRLPVVLADVANGLGPDYHTASSDPPKPGEPWKPGDYGADVLARWQFFRSTTEFADPPDPEAFGDPERTDTELQLDDPTSWKG